MPKQLKELTKFMHGTVSAPSGTDIPEEAATYSKNLDPVTETGKLKGVPDHVKTKLLSEGMRKDIRYWTTPPTGANGNHGTPKELVSGDIITITVSAGDYTASTAPITYATSNNDTWDLIFQQFSTGAIVFELLAEEEDNAGVYQIDSDNSAHEAIESGFDDILAVVTPLTGGTPPTTADDYPIINGLLFEGKAEHSELIVTFTTTQVSTDDLTVNTLGDNGDEYTSFLEIAANEFEFLRDGGKDSLVFYDKEDNNSMKILDDFYGTQGIIEGYSTDAATSGTAAASEASQDIVPFNLANVDDVSIESYYNALYLGPSAANKAKWMGNLDNKQMGQVNKGFDLLDAELYPVDGPNGAASLDRGCEFWSGVNQVNTSYWIGINSSSFSLFTVDKTTGEIVASDEQLPIRPTVITLGKVAVGGVWNNIYIANAESDTIYRIEGLVVDGSTGQVTWTSISRISMSFGTDGTHNKPSASILVDLLETYDSTANAVPSNVLWGLFAAVGDDSLTHEESYLFSCATEASGTNTDYINTTTAGADDSAMWRDRSIASPLATKRHGWNWYDIGSDGANRGIDFTAETRYISNRGSNQRRKMRFYYHHPADESNATNFEDTSTYSKPEDGYAQVKYVYDDLTRARKEPSASAEGNPTHGYPSDSHKKTNKDNCYGGEAIGWAEGLEVRPLRLIDMTYHNVDRDMGDANNRVHSVGVAAVINGTFITYGGRICHYHKIKGSAGLSHQYNYTLHESAKKEVFNGLSLIYSNTSHYGYKHLYTKGGISDDPSTGTSGVRIGNAAATVDSKGVRGCCWSKERKIGVLNLAANTAGPDPDGVPILDNINKLYDVNNVGTDMTESDSNETFVLSYAGSEPGRAYLAAFDFGVTLTPFSAERGPVSKLEYKGANYQPASSESQSPMGGLVHPPNDDLLFQGSILLNKEVDSTYHDFLISPTAGQYQNATVRLTPGSGLWSSPVAQDSPDTLNILNDDSKADFGINIAAGESDAEGSFTSGVYYYYKVSLMYDGFQESPMTIYADKYKATSQLKSLVLTVYMKRPVSKRCTHIVIYRRNGSDEFYKMVKEISLKSAWLEVKNQSNTVEAYKKSIVDLGHVGATYEAITGMPELLRQTSVNYTLSTQGDGCLIVANCNHPEIENGENFIFKSQPGNLSVFNWAQDYVIMPQVPKAIRVFGGKLFVFDSNNMHKVNIGTLSVEDTYEGISCSSENSIKVTDLGMFFCDLNNMYQHTGSYAKPIGDPILQSSEGTNAYAWHDINHDTPPQVGYNPKTTSVYFFFNHKPVSGDNIYMAWVYNIRLKRWDLMDTPKPLAVVSGPLNELLVSDGTNLWKINASNAQKAWSFYSKDITLGSVTQKKKVKTIKIEADDIAKLNGKVSLEVDDASGTFDTDYSGTKDNAFLMSPTGDSKKLKKMAVTLTDVTTEVDAIGIVYRPLKVK